MPGITGAHSPGAASRLAEMEAALYRASSLCRYESRAAADFACAVHSRRPGCGVLERGGTVLAFEGYTHDTSLQGEELLRWLLDGFLEKGPCFLEGLGGSFQAAVCHQAATWLFADAAASRRLFYAADERGLFFAPEVAPLAPLFPGLDPANLVQFLISGRFFAGRTLLPEVRQLLPGESVVFRDGRLERRRHFLYEVRTNERRNAERLAGNLGDLLDRSVLRAWAASDSPVILLSGGYDSRYILHAVARHLPDPSRLKTALWGERMDEPGSDNAIARQVAALYGATHLTLPWRADRLPEQFDAMFLAQSGMTEMTFTHADELEVFRMLAEEHGFRSALRGDECFGPKGDECGSVEAALRQVSMARPGQVAESGSWLVDGGRDWLEAHEEAMERLIARAPETPSELRDTLYGRERLPAMLQHHNYHKLHFLEMANPFLDREVLRFWSALPPELRVDKRLFKRCYHARWQDPVPIASEDNGIDWPAAVRRHGALAAWIREELAALPEPLDRGYFVGKLDAVLRGEPEAAGPLHQVPAMKLIARAAVLGRWLRTWARAS